MLLGQEFRNSKELLAAARATRSEVGITRALPAFRDAAYGGGMEQRERIDSGACSSLHTHRTSWFGVASGGRAHAALVVVSAVPAGWG